jgi:hypothetical protein
MVRLFPSGSTFEAASSTRTHCGRARLAGGVPLQDIPPQRRGHKLDRSPSGSGPRPIPRNG